MSRRSLSRVAVTRRMAKELGDEFDDLVSSALLLAEIADDPDARADSRIRAVVEWKSTIAEISVRLVDASRKEASWQASRPYAV